RPAHSPDPSPGPLGPPPSQPLADHLLPREPTSRPGFVDQRDRRRLGVVGGGELAPAQHGDAERAEETAGDAAELVVGAGLGGAGQVTLDVVAPVAGSLE